MNEEINIYKVLKLARDNAAQDLKLSNDILSEVDKLLEAVEHNNQDLNVTDITNSLVEIALQLTDQSKQISAAISRLAGAL